MKHYKKIEEMLESELGDYSYFKWELNYDEDYDEYEYYTVEIKTTDERTKTLKFRVDDKVIEIEMGEDHWNETITFDFRVKYFWMALLSWDI